VATKIDALDEPERLESLRRQASSEGKPFRAVSSVTNTGVRELINDVAAKLDQLAVASDEAQTLQLAL
jgi:hypothetical protein